nr:MULTISPECIES: hypothetical protein [unclassified Endozoicomonas]
MKSGIHLSPSTSWPIRKPISEALSTATAANGWQQGGMTNV